MLICLKEGTFKLNLKSMSLSNCGVTLWNGLESKLKSCRNVQVFKTCFKEKCVHTYDLN